MRHILDPLLTTNFGELGIDAGVVENLQDLGIVEPTPIQSDGIPAILSGRDVVGKAPTGSGKTLAFMLPIAQLVETVNKSQQALVLAPTRELAQQIEHSAREALKGSDVSTVLIYGGVSYEPQLDGLKSGAQIVIGTPGRVMDHMKSGNMSVENLSILCLDEADRMLDEGFGPDIDAILQMLPNRQQTLLFSATVPSRIQNLLDRYLENPEWLEPAAESMEPDIEHEVLVVPLQEKSRALRWLIENSREGSTLVFGRTKAGIKRLESDLLSYGYKVRALQGDLTQQQRDRILEWFRKGHGEIMLATNVAARGLDITSIGTVINYDPPEDPEMFTHRVGRTGRMGRSGVSVTLVAGTDLLSLGRIEQMMGGRIKRTYWEDVRPNIISDEIQSQSVTRRETGAAILPGESIRTSVPKSDTSSNKNPNSHKGRAKKHRGRSRR